MTNNDAFNQPELSNELDSIKESLLEANYSPRFFSNKRTCKQALQVVEEVQRSINTFKPRNTL